MPDYLLSLVLRLSMRGIVVFTLVFAFVFPVLPALAAKGKKGNTDAKFEKLDTNNDGQLSKAEFTGKKKNKKGGRKGKAKKGKAKKENKKDKKKDGKKKGDGKGKKNKKTGNS